MNAQKRDLLTATRRAHGPDAVMICECGADAAPFSCYCERCERCEEEEEVAKCTDGWYAIYADGSDWVAVLLRQGKMVGLTEESLCSTHAAAGDRRAPICLAIANSDTSPVSKSVANAVVAAYDADLDPYMCVVEKIGG